MTVTEAVEANYGLILDCARSFKPVYPLTEHDIIQIASLAFVKSYPKFNPEKSTFSTFVYNCMKNAIITELHRAKKYDKVECNEERIIAMLTEPEVINIEEYLPNCSAKEKTLILMLRDGYDGKEIQNTLGISKKEFKQLKLGIFKRIQKCHLKS